MSPSLPSLLSKPLCVVAFLALPLAAFADIQLTSFESGFGPWSVATTVGGNGDVVTSSISSTLSTDGTQSAQAVYSPTSGTYSPVISAGGAFNSGSYATILNEGTTAISVDVYFDWTNAPSSPNGATYYGLNLNLNSANTGYQNIGSTSGGLQNGQWSTITFDLTPSLVSQLTTSGWSSVGFLLSAGTYGYESDNVTPLAVSGTIQMNFDNIVAVGAASPVPEPSTYALILGLVAAGGVALRRRRRSA